MKGRCGWRWLVVVGGRAGFGARRIAIEPATRFFSLWPYFLGRRSLTKRPRSYDLLDLDFCERPTGLMHTRIGVGMREEKGEMCCICVRDNEILQNARG